MPFAVTMGNHDAEPQYMSKKDIYDRLLMRSPFFVGSHGPKGIHGHGQHVIPVYGEKNKDKAEALLYCIDSNDYPETDELGHYDWIHFDQLHGIVSRASTTRSSTVAVRCPHWRSSI